ncbi:ATP-binding protein [Pseudonocardiaceae bacterium YIM PH 21723]|nr:ATP-binding protein [Pseudonocardiaceae bacterium YIM PH 21723]
MLDIERSGTEYSRTLTGDLSELSTVRAWIGTILGELEESRREDVLLVVDELVSNVLQHARGPARLRLCLRNTTLRVEVRDGSRTPARLRPPDLTGGRGMHIVSACTSTWGQEFVPGGKIVWAEFPTMCETT